MRDASGTGYIAESASAPFQGMLPPVMATRVAGGMTVPGAGCLVGDSVAGSR
ncbi:MAG: hypothetical protein AVDCRST_MAG87-3065 [uncultured Thermomicrobiales bacterium]|uniref:Uncharacterized protein n=1 Tax=uncultured Thermomicrobiales bacterium TaxID=1645740 RepID=A0A6J4VFS7_9BACT|nr:MAG: hypothetical protein AVDCRST_MAG87-3065 [uncultured Thermomicrobiales bacterium]